MLVSAARHLLRFGGAALAALSLATSAQAGVASCWDGPSISAARVSEFETLLMVTSLRCRTIGVDMHASFEHFVTNNKQVFEASHLKLRAHFGVADRKGASDSAYDHFVTSVANAYGMGRTEPGVCTQFAALIDNLDKGMGGEEFIASVVMQMVRDPRLDGVRCSVTASVAPLGK